MDQSTEHDSTLKKALDFASGLVVGAKVPGFDLFSEVSTTAKVRNAIALGAPIQGTMRTIQRRPYFSMSCSHQSAALQKQTFRHQRPPPPSDMAMPTLRRWRRIFERFGARAVN